MSKESLTAAIWILCLLGTILTLMVYNPSIAAKTPERGKYELSEPFEFQVVDGNSYISPHIPPELPYQKTITCLAWEESRNTPDVISLDINNKYSYGLLQFQAATFKGYCVEKYNLTDNWQRDILKASIQKQCASQMLQEDYKNIYHWGTYKRCIGLE